MMKKKKFEGYKGIQWFVHTDDYDDWSEGLKALLIISIILTLPLWVIAYLLEATIWGRQRK
jgi:hypothetical protein